MRSYTIDFASEVQTGTRVVRARTPAGAMRAFTKNWSGEGPDPWTFVITIRSDEAPTDLGRFLRHMLSLEAVRRQHRQEGS